MNLKVENILIIIIAFVIGYILNRIFRRNLVEGAEPVPSPPTMCNPDTGGLCPGGKPCPPTGICPGPPPPTMCDPDTGGLCPGGKPCPRCDKPPCTCPEVPPDLSPSCKQAVKENCQKAHGDGVSCTNCTEDNAKILNKAGCSKDDLQNWCKKKCPVVSPVTCRNYMTSECSDIEDKTITDGPLAGKLYMDALYCDSICKKRVWQNVIKNPDTAAEGIMCEDGKSCSGGYNDTDSKLLQTQCKQDFCKKFIVGNNICLEERKDVVVGVPGVSDNDTVNACKRCVNNYTGDSYTYPESDKTTKLTLGMNSVCSLKGAREQLCETGNMSECEKGLAAQVDSMVLAGADCKRALEFEREELMNKYKCTEKEINNHCKVYNNYKQYPLPLPPLVPIADIPWLQPPTSN